MECIGTVLKRFFSTGSPFWKSPQDYEHYMEERGKNVSKENRNEENCRTIFGYEKFHQLHGPKVAEGVFFEIKCATTSTRECHPEYPEYNSSPGL